MSAVTIRKVLKKGGKSESVVLLHQAGQFLVRKTYALQDPSHRQGFEHECKILRRLERLGCNFVPRLLAVSTKNKRGILYMTYCGAQTPDNGKHRSKLRALIKRLGQEYGLYRFHTDRHKTTATIHPKNSCWDGKQYYLIDFGSSLWAFR